MKTYNITPIDIGLKVNAALLQKRMSTRSCCKEFNLLNETEINSGKLRRLDKDFVQRVRKGKFRVVSSRVAKLCEFLKIKCSTQDNPLQAESVFKQEINFFDELVDKNPKLKSKIKKLFKDIAEVVNIGEKL